MNVKAFATYTAVFVAGAGSLLGLNALSGNHSVVAGLSPENSLSISTSEYSAAESPSPAAGHDLKTGQNDESVSPPAAADELTAIADLERNTFVTVQGTVERVTDEDEFLIADQSGSVRVWTSNNFFTVEPGEFVVVEGFVDDDVFLEIYAQEITRADGTVISISSSNG